MYVQCMARHSPPHLVHAEHVDIGIEVDRRRCLSTISTGRHGSAGAFKTPLACDLSQST